MDQKHLDQGAEHPVLGPHYFAARYAAEKLLADFDATEFNPILKKMADDLYSALHQRVEDYLLSNVECNLQGTIWRQIDDSVKALMSGEKWALDRYALTEKYNNGEKIREAVAKHIPVELQNARIADLEAEVKRLKENLAWYRR